MKATNKDEVTYLKGKSKKKKKAKWVQLLNLNETPNKL